MITSLARQLTQQLCDAGVLAPEHSELYEYGFFLILSRIIFGIITLLTGIVLGVAFESMTFYCMFLLIRGYAGGVHAHKESICMVFTTATMCLAVIGIFLLKQAGTYYFAWVAQLVSAATIITIAPVESKEKPLDADMRERYSKICTGIIAVCIAISSVSFSIRFYSLFRPCTVALTTSACLAVAGKVAQKNR